MASLMPDFLYDFVIGDYRYGIYNGTNTVGVRAYDQSKAYYEDIPSTVEYNNTVYTVVEANSCFFECHNLIAGPEIPSTVTSIENCFADCENLQYVHLATLAEDNSDFLGPDYSVYENVVQVYLSLSEYTDEMGYLWSTRIANRYQQSGTYIAKVDGFYDADYRYPDKAYGQSAAIARNPLKSSYGTIPSSIIYEDETSSTGYSERPVTTLDNCFKDCTNLIGAPAIPSGVTSMANCFKGCTSLSGRVYVNTVPSAASGAEDIFAETVEDIVLDFGNLERFASWMDGGLLQDLPSNVQLARYDLLPSPTYTLDAIRVAANKSTAKTLNGEWIYLVLDLYYYEPDPVTRVSGTNQIEYIETSVSTDIVDPVPSPYIYWYGDITPYLTWYTSEYAAAEDALSLPAASSNGHLKLHAWVHQAIYTDGLDKIDFTVSVRDRWVSGANVTKTVPKTYFTMDFLMGGEGVSFGKPATQQGLDVAMDSQFRSRAEFNERVIFNKYAGFIQMFAGSTPPEGWLLCDGRAVSRDDYYLLYRVIGTTYGAGDGSTTFNLPDLRGRAPIGAGQGTGLTNRVLGAASGEESHTLTVNEVPLKSHDHYMDHRHPINSHSHAMPHRHTHNHTHGMVHYHNLVNHTHDHGSHTHTVSGGITSSGSCTISSSGGHEHTVRREQLAGSGSNRYAVSGSASTVSTTGGGNHTHTVPNHTHTHNISVSGGNNGKTGTPSKNYTGGPYTNQASAADGVSTDWKGTTDGLTTTTLGTQWTSRELGQNGDDASYNPETTGSGRLMTQYSVTIGSTAGSETARAYTDVASSNAAAAHNLMQPSLAVNYIICTGE